jgi:uncharacterized protein YbjQ (UPF0145 family)
VPARGFAAPRTGNVRGVLVTTIDHVPGHRVSHTIGEVIGLTLRLDNKYSEGLKDLHGVTAEDRVAQLIGTRQEAVEHMIAYAARLGANAIVGMRFDHRSIAGDYNEIVAYGTGVVIVPIGGETAVLP